MTGENQQNSEEPSNKTSHPETSTESAQVKEEISNADRVVNYFSQRSGLTPEEVKQALGPWIGSQLNMDPEQVLPQHIHPQDSWYQGLLSNFERYNKYNPLNGRVFFWRDLLLHRYNNQPEFKQYVETISNGRFKEIFTSDAVLLLKPNLELYDSEKPASFETTLTDEDKERILQDVGTPEQAAENIEKAQHGLEEALRIGKELRAQGYVPIFRYLFFRDNLEAKKAFIDQYKDQQNFLPQHNTSLDGLTLKDISRHTDAKSPNSPLDSWTYVAPNADWSYGTNKLARVPAVLLVSKVKLEDTLKMKRFGGLYGPEEDTFYQSLDDSGTQLNEKTTLAELAAQGKKGVFVTNEAEITMWGPQPKEALIDLGP